MTYDVHYDDIHLKALVESEQAKRDEAHERNHVSETLSQHQRRFAKMVGILIDWIYANGYEAVLGECQRTQAQADLNAKTGAGISNSLHIKCLAIDISLFKDGKYLTETEDYTTVGEFWESIGGSWGGRFQTRPDGDHFSLEWEGVR